MRSLLDQSANDGLRACAATKPANNRNEADKNWANVRTPSWPLAFRSRRSSPLARRNNLARAGERRAKFSLDSPLDHSEEPFRCFPVGGMIEPATSAL